MIELIIPGKPLGKQRPRIVRPHGSLHPRAITPAQTVQYENLVKMVFLETCPGANPLDAPVRMRIDAYLQIPKSTSKTRQSAMAAHRIRPTKTPDADNIAKIISDALNGIAYTDDKQIVSMQVEKFYSHRPRVEVKIYEVN